jgi:RNA polymerase sigma-70 factor (ECF subfamily)
MQSKSDTFYIEETLAGNEDAFAGLVDRYQHMVYTLCHKMLDHSGIAEEVAQDVFIKCYRSLASYNGRSQFSTWLYTITYNACIDAIKKRKRHAADPLEHIDRGEQETIEQEDLLEREDKQNVIQSAIQQLNKEERMIVILFYYEEMSLKEIAKVMNLKENNVKVKLHRCRQKLSELLKDQLSLI